MRNRPTLFVLSVIIHILSKTAVYAQNGVPATAASRSPWIMILIGSLFVAVSAFIVVRFIRFSTSRQSANKNEDNLSSVTEDKETAETPVTPVKPPGYEGKRIKAALLFTDIRQYNQYSSGKDPLQSIRFLHEILSAQAQIIHTHEGIVSYSTEDKLYGIFTGDNAVLSACTSALEIMHVLDDRDRFDGLELAAGLHFGDILFGRICENGQERFLVIGDTAQKAEILCSVSRKRQILISHDVYSSVRDSIKVDGPLRLQGKGGEIDLTVFYLLSEKDEKDDDTELIVDFEDESGIHNDASRDYENRNVPEQEETVELEEIGSVDDIRELEEVEEIELVEDLDVLEEIEEVEEIEDL